MKQPFEKILKHSLFRFIGKEVINGVFHLTLA